MQEKHFLVLSPNRDMRNWGDEALKKQGNVNLTVCFLTGGNSADFLWKRN